MKNFHAKTCAFALATISLLSNPAAASSLSILGAMDADTDIPNQPVTADNEVTPETTRREIFFASSLPVGSILVKTKQRKLYFIEANHQALEFAVSVGREGFSWTGISAITRKAEWPVWRPPSQMIEREAARGHVIPNLVKGGPSNPLGARALYLGTSDYRIHGTDKPWSIGHASSSGCIRMMNVDVIELYGRAQIGARVVVE